MDADFPQENTWADFYHNGKIAVLQPKPLLLRSGQLTEEQFEQLYQQMLIEMHEEHFIALWDLTSIWGKLPRESR